tara:strand:- start:385 stop:594 length:210 start_codon:yes stop_codon:yes gene_type:complete
LLNERGEVVGLLTGGGKNPDGSWESIWITHEAITHAVNVAQPIADDLHHPLQPGLTGQTVRSGDTRRLA